METARRLILVPEDQYRQLKSLAAAATDKQGEEEASLDKLSNSKEDESHEVKKNPPEAQTPLNHGPEKDTSALGDESDVSAERSPHKERNLYFDVDYIVDSVPKKSCPRTRKLLGWIRIKGLISWRKSDGLITAVKPLDKKPIQLEDYEKQPLNIIDLIRDTQNAYKQSLLSEQVRRRFRALLVKAKTPNQFLGNPYYMTSGQKAEAPSAAAAAAAAAAPPFSAAAAAAAARSTWQSL